MRYTLAFVYFFLLMKICPVHAQPTGTSSNFSIGKIFGQVLDSTSNEGIEYATVKVIRLRNDSIIGGAITNKKGIFLVEGLPMGVFKVEIDFMGYQSQSFKRVPILMNMADKDLGKIILAPSATSLELAEVTAERPFMVNAIDRKVYNVEQITTADGGSATELLQNIPSVEVDIDGNVSLRGSGNVNILIDGKPSGLTGSSRTAILEQIPANTIESIEVVTNPSAKFDPDGMAGIINIVLKKNQKPGWNGTASIGAGTQGQYNTNINLNMRSSKYNIYGMYGLRTGTFRTSSYTFRQNLLLEDPFEIIQNEEGSRTSNSHLLRGGIDLYLSPKTTFSLGATWNTRNRNSDGLLQTQEKNSNLELMRFYDRDNLTERGGSSHDLRATWQTDFNKEKQQLIIDVNYSAGDNPSEGEYLQTEYISEGITLSDPSIERSRDANLGDSRISTIQADYVHPIGQRSLLEVGMKTIIRNLGSDFFAENFDPVHNEFLIDESQSNQFNYSEQIHAAYITFSRELGKFSFQAGIRAEQALTDSELVNTGETFENDYFSLFPTLHSSFDLGKDQEIMASYSKRIDRPSLRSLNPFPNVTDPFNIRIGNPFLNPEYIHSLEVGYSKFWKSSSISGNVYYKDIQDVIQRYKLVDDQGVSTTTYENLASGRNYGLELIGRVQFNKKWNANSSLNVFRTEIDGSNLEGDLNNDAYGASLRFMNSNQLWKNSDLQLTAFYRSPRNVSQGRIEDFYAFNIALRQRFADKKGTITLSIRDLFNTMQLGFITETDTFYQESERRRQSRVLNVSISYRFGKAQRDVNRRRGNREGSRETDGGGQDFEID